MLKIIPMSPSLAPLLDTEAEPPCTGPCFRVTRSGEEAACTLELNEELCPPVERGEPRLSCAPGLGGRHLLFQDESISLPGTA